MVYSNGERLTVMPPSVDRAEPLPALPTLTTPTALPACEISPELTLRGVFAAGRDILVTGHFEGRLLASGRVTISSTGRLVGAIEASGLALEPGHQIKADLQIGVSSIKPAALAIADVPESATGSAWPQRLKKLRDLVLRRK